MVLGAGLKPGGWALAAAALAGCSPPSGAAAPAPTPTSAAETVTDRATLGGAAVELVARGGACVLRRAGTADAALAPAAPCRFLRVDGAVQRHAYPDRAIDAVAMVVGSPADAERLSYFGAADAGWCGTVAQGLVVRGASVAPARRSMSGGLFCADKGRDEKDFHAVAHEGDARPDRR